MRKIEWNEVETVAYTDYLAEYILDNTPEQTEGLSDILDEYIIDNKIYLKRLYEDAFHNDGFIPFFENRDKVRKWFNLYELEIDDLLSGEYGDDVELPSIDYAGVLYTIVHSVWQYVAGVMYKMIEKALNLEPVAVSDEGMVIYDVVHGFDDAVIAGYHGEAPELYIIQYDEEGNAGFDNYYMSDFIRVNYPEL